MTNTATRNTSNNTNNCGKRKYILRTKQKNYYCLNLREDWLIDWLIDWTLFLNGEDISTKADSHICRCYSATNNQDIPSEIIWREEDRESLARRKSLVRGRETIAAGNEELMMGKLEKRLNLGCNSIK